MQRWIVTLLAYIQKGRCPIRMPKARSQRLEKVLDQGRVSLYAVQVVKEVFVFVDVIYGWAGASQMKEMAPELTTSLL